VRIRIDGSEGTQTVTKLDGGDVVRTTLNAWASLVVTAIALGTPPVSAQADEAAIGNWRGTLTAGPQQLEVLFNVTRGHSVRTLSRS
jgi:hypothetical protein